VNEKNLQTKKIEPIKEKYSKNQKQI